MERIAEFVYEHISDDTTRLILDREKWPGIDMDLVVNCIESRRKLKGKVQEWYNEPLLIFPYKLSAEQCSSSATARYKAVLAAAITTASLPGITSASLPGITTASLPGIATPRHPKLTHRHPKLDLGSPLRLADLTGGLGVDSWFFSKVFDEVLYNEMQPKLYEAALHNFKVLEAGNVRCSCSMAAPGGLGELLEGFVPDIIYMDPARRGEGGKKVFLLEDCTPDVLTLRDEIFGICRHILLKLSPMADITMVCDRLGSTCREVHIVATAGECKELLIWLDREWTSGYTITAVTLGSTPRPYSTESPSDSVPSGHSGLDPESPFTFSSLEEKTAAPTLTPALTDYSGLFLFEPGKALMKSGAFNLISNRFGITKLGHSTHYYITEDTQKAADLSAYGKIFKILSSAPLDKRSIKAASQAYPRAEVTARNIPMDTDTLRKKLCCTPSDTHHIFGLRSDLNGNLLLVTERYFYNETKTEGGK